MTDCGCFGDALKLTPWESFTKDVVLLVFIIILFFNRNLIKPIFGRVVTNVLVLFSLVFCCWFGWYVLNHLPVIDFRAYKVGTNIEKGMEIPADAPKSEIELVFIYNVNGVETEFTDKELDKIPADAEFIDRRDKVIKQGYVPPIHDFTLEREGEDYTEEMLHTPKLIMLISYDLNKASDDGIAKLVAFAKKATENGYKVIGATASGEEVIMKKKLEHNLTFDYYFCDSTTLKTIERANPSIVVLKNGTIVQKAHWNDIDEVILD